MKKIIFAILFLIPSLAFAEWGDTWTQVGTGANWSQIDCNSDGSICVANTLNGFIYNSTDSGATWTQRDSARNWRGVYCADTINLCVSTVSNGQIYTSTDSGATWTARDGNRPWNFVSGSSNGDLIVAGNYPNGKIYISTNFGVTWTGVGNNGNWRDIDCSDDGYLCVASDSTSGFLYRSVDRGNTWTQATGFSNGTALGLRCTGDGLLCMAGNVTDNGLYFSNDLGATWSNAGTIATYPRAVELTEDGGKMLVGGNGGTAQPLYVSSNSGSTFFPRTGSGLWVDLTCTNNSELCFGLATNSQIYRTYNPLPPPNMDIFFTQDGLYEFATMEMWITTIIGIFAFINLFIFKGVLGKN